MQNLSDEPCLIARSLALVAGKAAYATLPAGGQSRIALKLSYRGPLVAPVAKGAHIADLGIVVDGRPAGSVPLLAAASVARAGPLDRLVNGIAGWLPW